MNGTFYFSADSGTIGYELWKSDGTSAGTVLVKDINAAAGTSSIQFMTNVNGTLYFRADDGVNGTELWKSDGTSAGTVLVKDIVAGANGSAPLVLTNINGTLYFNADDGVHGTELWKSDGTSAGTVLVKDIRSGAGGSDPNFLTNVNGTLFFVANDFNVTGAELWKTDGTSAGTVLVQDNSVGNNGSYPKFLTNVNGTLYFAANDNDLDTNRGSELWRSDGTCAGTFLVREIFTFSGGALGSYPSYLTNVNGTLFFRAMYDDGMGGFSYELWKSDGTCAGTVLIKDILPGPLSSNLRYLTNVNGTLYFNADNGTNGFELWKSDGSNGGTVLVKDINPGAGNSLPKYLTNVNGTLYFQASDGASGAELWKSDGTSTGTVLVGDIRTGVDSSSPALLTNVGGTLFFSAVQNDMTGRQLWKLGSGSGGGGSTLTINGTPGVDNLTIQFTNLPTVTVTINGTSTNYDTSMMNTFVFDGMGGNDVLAVYTSAGANPTNLTTTGATVSGAGFTFSASNTEYKYIFGDALDSATFSDTAGNDQLYQLPGFSLMLDGGLTYYNQVIGFGSSTVNASTGNDILLVYGSGSNDTYTASTTTSLMTSTGLTLAANGFDNVYAFGSGGNDTANFTGSSGDENFYGLGGYGFEVVTSGMFLQYLIGFSQVTATGGSGNDSAIFFDAAGNDTFTASPTSATMAGSGYSDTVTGFDGVYAFASGGGVDTANLDGSDQNDLFSGNAFNAAMFRVDVYLLQVYGFRQVNANLSTGNGTDLAELIDGFGDDVLNASGSQAEITYAAGNKIKVAAFDLVFAKSQNGGVNTENVANPLTYQLILDGTWV